MMLVPVGFMGAGAGGSGGSPTFRYLRLRVLTQPSDSASNAPALANVRWLVGGTSYPTQNMTGYAAPSPLVASSSTDYDTTTYQAWRAFDSASSTFWNPQLILPPHWLQIDLGAGNGIAPTAISITPITDALYLPTSFVCQGSNTGSFSGEETLLYTSPTGLTSGWAVQTPRVFTF